jgi:hypothetical protein
MTKQEKIEFLKEKIVSKFGEKSFDRLSIIAQERFGKKTDLKLKFFQSVIEGYIKTEDIWVSDETIILLKEKIDSTPDDKKETLLLEILDTYDTKDPKVKQLLIKYSKILSKHIKPEKISVVI